MFYILKLVAVEKKTKFCAIESIDGSHNSAVSTFRSIHFCLHPFVLVRTAPMDIFFFLLINITKFSCERKEYDESKKNTCSFKIVFNPLYQPAVPRVFLKSNLAWRSPVEPSAPLTRLLQEVVVFLTLNKYTVQGKSKHHEKIINSLNSINSLKSSAPLMPLLQEVVVFCTLYECTVL